MYVEDWDNGPSIEQVFAYQLTEHLLLAGVRPEVFAKHPKVKGVCYHPGRGLVLVRCGGLERRSVIEAVAELQSLENK